MSELERLWDDRVPFPTLGAVPELSYVTHATVHLGMPGDYAFLHESSVAWHRGVLHAAWANDPEGECSPDGACRGRRSHDGGATWSPPETLAPPLPGEERHNHGELFSDGDTLHCFVARYGVGEGRIFPGVVTERCTLDDASGAWVDHGVVARGFWPFSKPVRCGDGWAMPGVDKDTYPVVALSAGDDLGAWDVVSVPAPDGLIFVEPTLWADGDSLTLVMRYEPRDRKQREAVAKVALVSRSHDGGRTWTPAAESNLPMAMSKAYAGVLSTGQRYLLANLGNRDMLTIAVSAPGERLLSKVWSVRRGRSPEPRTPGWCKSPQWAYPCADEHDGRLYITYSVAKEDCALSIVPIEALAV